MTWFDSSVHSCTAASKTRNGSMWFFLHNKALEMFQNSPLIDGTWNIRMSKSSFTWLNFRVCSSYLSFRQKHESQNCIILCAERNEYYCRLWRRLSRITWRSNSVFICRMPPLILCLWSFQQYVYIVYACLGTLVFSIVSTHIFMKWAEMRSGWKWKESWWKEAQCQVRLRM